jgi:hypothetical protein
MDDRELAAIEQRARLWLDYGDRDAFRPDDLRALLAEIREVRADHAHARALIRQGLDDLAQLRDQAAEAVMDRAWARHQP